MSRASYRGGRPGKGGMLHQSAIIHYVLDHTNFLLKHTATGLDPILASSSYYRIER